MTLLYGLMLFSLILFEVQRTGLKSIDYHSLFLFAFAIAYPLPGVLGARSDSSDLQTQVYAWLLITLFILTFIITWSLYKPVKFYRAWPQVDQRICIWVIYGCPIFAIASAFVYASNYGGLSEAIAQTSRIRSGHVEAGSLVFAKRFLPVSAIGMIGSILLTTQKSIVWRTVPILLNSLAFVVSFMLLGSRGFLVLTILILILSAISKLQIVSRVCMLGFTAASLAFYLLVGKKIFQSLSGTRNTPDEAIVDISENALNGAVDVSDLVSREFGHPIQSLEVSIQKSSEFLLFFTDIPAAILSLIPSIVYRIDTSRFDISYLNTHNITGIWDSTIPPGIVGYSMYAAHAGGVILVPVVLAIALKKLDSIFNFREQTKFYYLFGVMINYRIIQGDFRIFLQANFTFVIFAIILVFMSRSSKRKRRSLSAS